MQYFDVSGLVSAEDVEATTSTEILAQDMDLELLDIFRRKEQKLIAVSILGLLPKKGALNQKAISRELNIPQNTIGRIIRKLATYEYVTKQRGEQGEWINSTP